MARGDFNTQSSTNTSEAADKITIPILSVQAEEKLQAPLDDVIISFNSRYPNVQVLVRYVPPKMLLTLANTSTSNNKISHFVVNTDLIIANDNLTQTRLLPLQALINNAQAELNKSKGSANSMVQNDTTNHETRNLSSFSYALQGEQAVDGVILTDNPIAISFRNFLLSSVGQDILKKHDYNNIDGYKNSMDDLFNTKSRTKIAANESSVKVTDALSNGK